MAMSVWLDVRCLQSPGEWRREGVQEGRQRREMLSKFARHQQKARKSGTKWRDRIRDCLLYRSTRLQPVKTPPQVISRDPLTSEQNPRKASLVSRCSRRLGTTPSHHLQNGGVHHEEYGKHGNRNAQTMI